MTRKAAASGASKGSLKAVEELYDIASEVYDQLRDGQIPKMVLPLRTKANIRFDTRSQVWKYGPLKGARTAKKLKGALMLLRTMYVLEFIKDMIDQNKSSTLREMYYISEGWDLAKFHSQDESNMLAEDLEIITACVREDFRLRPEESGASVIGNLTIEETTRNGENRRINCRDDVGDAGYTIPYNVEKEKVRFRSHDAKFVMGVETGGMFDRLVENGFDESAKCILVHLKGQPSRSTRRLLKRLNEELKLPVTTFSVHGDERIMVWDKGMLKPVTIGPFVDDLMKRFGATARSSPIPHERTSTDFIDLAVPCITAAGTLVERGRVTAVLRHDAPEELYDVQTAYGYSVRVTGAHSVMVLEDLNLVPRAVKDLRPGDLAVAALGLPRGQEVREVDILELLKRSPVAERLREESEVPEGLGDAGATNGHGAVSLVKSEIQLPSRIHVSPSLARLLGYFAAEGSATPAHVILSFGSHEVDLIEDATRCVQDVFPGVPVHQARPHPYEVQLTFGGQLMSEVFRSLGAGHGAHSKTVPPVVFSMSRTEQLAFLKAYIRGDGHVRRRATGAEIAMTTVSRALASDIVALCASLGLTASIGRRRSTASAIVPDRGSGFTKNTVYDIKLHGELAQLRPFQDLIDQHREEGAESRQRVHSKFLAIPRELITPDMRRIIRRFNQGKGVGQFGDIYWGCKRITYPVLARFFENIPLGVSEPIDFLRRLVRQRIAVLPIRRILRIPSGGGKVYDLEVPGAQTFLGGLGPLCLHNTDGDPWSFRIHASVAYGAIKTAHISEYLATPTAEFIGITASDIVNYNLPTDGLSPRDVGALHSEQTDPRFNDKFWKGEIETMLGMNKKAEQQALAKYGLDYVTDTYLPEKLGEIGIL